VWLIAGLGNPGSKYADTRHNVGFWVIDELSMRHTISLKKRVCSSLIGRGKIADHEVILAKPLSFMNLSGIPLEQLVRTFQISLHELLIVHDEIDLPLGKVKLKIRGGDAGNKGMRSILEYLGSGDFTRIRVGIGRPDRGGDVSAYVLSPFFQEELDIIHGVVKFAADRVEEVVRRPQMPWY